MFRSILLSLLLTLPFGVAQAATVNPVTLSKLSPGRIYKAQMVDPLDASRLTVTEYQISTCLDASNRLRIDVDENLNGAFERIATATLVSNSTGLRLYEYKFGTTTLWMNENGILCPEGILIGASRTVDAWTTTARPITNAYGERHFTYGAEYGVYSTGDYGLLTGYFINWTWDVGPTFSLWTNTTGGLKGLELEWNYYLITQVLR